MAMKLLAALMGILVYCLMFLLGLVVVLGLCFLVEQTAYASGCQTGDAYMDQLCEAEEIDEDEARQRAQDQRDAEEREEDER